MRIFITGASGQVGSELVKLYKDTSHIVKGCSHADLDITNEKAVSANIDEFRPDAVFHCAAYTAVDKAETEPDKCYDVNVYGTKYLIEASKRHNAKFIYLSSDYVFDGTLDRPYEVDDETNPINIYGKSKLEGELIVKEYLENYFIVRTSWVFGNGSNFVNTMLRLAKSNSEIKIVSDQTGSPTYAYDLAKLLMEMIETEKYGAYHATNEGYCTWYDFACALFNLIGKEVNVIPIRSEEYSTLAKRPKNSRLSKNRLSLSGFTQLPTWDKAIHCFLEKSNDKDV